ARLPYLYSAVCLTSLSASYTYHRDLHSFPTRRSSDLAGRARNTFTHNMYAHEEDQLRLDDLMTAGLKKQPHPRHIHQQRNAADGDRKSTRLNSSHQIISYAVFCLKKKKKTDE